MVGHHSLSPVSGVQLETLAVFTDFSAGAETALKCAATIARRFKAGVVVAHAYNPISAFVGPEAAMDFEPLDDMRQSMENRLRELTESSLLHGVTCSTLLTMGDATDLLEELKDTDLIVVGTKGERGLVKAAIGSTAETLFRTSSLPVLTVGPHCHCDGEQGMPQKTVLYSTDFSPGAELAWPYALKFAEEEGIDLVLLNVKDDTDVPFTFERAMASEEPLQKLRSLLPKAAYLQSQPTCIVGFGSPATVILAEASDRKADLIVMGARGAGALTSIVSHFGGGTAYKVAAGASCPVLTIRA